jgi:tetratricopeptide (TPR) repeat protein
MILLYTTLVVGQSKEGYWDNVRTTNETFTLGAGKRKFIKTADFPEGTTEVVFRISLLDDNQKITSSLVSVLKASPDPTGISQGSAGAVFLASTISGSDKCKYAVFSNEKEAAQYESSGGVQKACMIQNTPINKEAKLLSSNSKCLLSGAKNIWFGFESDNWVMNEKIVLEVVPWVDYKLSSGWTKEAKKEIITTCRNLDVTALVTQKEMFCGSFLDLISQQYSYKEFKNLLPEEKSKVIYDYTLKALEKTGEINKIVSAVRLKAFDLFNNDKKQEAIELLQNEIVKNTSSPVDIYATLGGFYLMTKQFDKGLKTLMIAEQKNKEDLGVKLNLAHAYLLTNQFRKAKEIHKDFGSQNLSATISWKQQTETDIKEFERSGILNSDFKRIEAILN